MKRKLLIIAIIIIFVGGVAVMSYPLVSSVANNYANRQEGKEYTQQIAEMEDEELSEELSAAESYNKSLNNNVILTDPFDTEAYEAIGDGYDDVLNLDGNGLIGYIDIPKINVYLPIRHGTSESVLAHSAGHLQNTSMPIGGTSTHAVISAHSAYPGETFFDYLTDMEIGDVFYIHVLGETLKYEVDQIKVVLPEDTSDLRITTGEDYVTLVTCTPYSINTHRLLVRGTRVEYTEATEDTAVSSAVSANDGYIYFFGYRIPYWAAALIIAAFILFVFFFVIVMIRRSRKKSDSLPKHGLADADDEKDGGSS